MQHFKALTLFVILLVSSSVLTSNSFAAEVHRPFSEMKGDCDNFKVNLGKEFSAWDLKEQNVVSAKSDKNKPTLPIDEKVRLALNNESEVKLAASPDKKFPSDDIKYAGLIQILTPKKGTFRLSIGTKVWADLINPQTQKTVNALSFEMQTKCKKIFKTIEFMLEENKEYTLQITSSPAPFVDILFTKVN